MRKTKRREIYDQLFEALIRADEINAAHGTTLVLEGGGPIQVNTRDRLGHREPLSPWLSRQNAITWLNAFELGIVYTTKGADAAVGIVEPEGNISQEKGGER